MGQILNWLGAQVRFEGDAVHIQAKKIQGTGDYDLVRKMRGSICIMEADIAGFITIGAVVAFVAAQLLRTMRTHMTQKTLREAVKTGTAIDPELLMDAERSTPAGTNDLRIGMLRPSSKVASAL